MKILLIQPSSKKEAMSNLYPEGYSKSARSVLPPLGLYYLASYLKQKHEVVIIDMILDCLGLDDLPEILNSVNPDVVGVTAVIGLWGSVLNIVKKVKEINLNIHTVVGGPNVTYYTEETVIHENIDFSIVGYGQKPLMELCDDLSKGNSGENIVNCFSKNIKYDDYTTFYSSEYYLDNYPLPDRTFTRYQDYEVPFCPDNPTTTMITSMGCPYKCSFCTLIRPPVHIRSAENVVEEMRSIRDLGIKSVLFQDELFTANKKRVKEICELLITNDIQLSWSVKSRIDTVNLWMLKFMKKAGCFNIHFGIESGNDKTLKRMKKGYTCDKIKETVKLVKQAGLSVSGNFMLAYPGEDEKDILQTIDFARKLELDISQFSLTIDSPGSILFEEALSKGRVTEDYFSTYIKHPDPENSNLPTALFSAADKFSEEELQSFLSQAYNNTKNLFNIDNL